jgi:type IV pilus assembly protein PilQ
MPSVEPDMEPVTIPPVRIAEAEVDADVSTVDEPSDSSWSQPRPSPAPADEASEPRWEAEAPWPESREQLVERAPARQVLPSTPGPAAQFETKQVASDERQFTGDPISLSLKDADIKDILKMFATLTNLNIVLDRGVSGSVTVELKDVPWDQALDLILRINNLDYVLENNVLRVAPLRQLEAERASRAAYLRQQALSGPMSTVVRPLSYAEASEVAGLLQSGGGGGEVGNFLLSERGVVVVNERTNTLIIRELTDRVEGLMALVDTLDTPTPQVVIEARIVETTRDFSERLGVNWGFSSVMDAEHGNDTGLDFPNEIEFGGGVNYGVAAPGRGDGSGVSSSSVLAFTFTDILNTFNLDFQLTAAESDGLVKVISTPKITAQNNETANIQSGVQLPVQTVANNTTTVQYIDVTLSLNVTPQITAEGTIMLDVQIAKKEPAVGLAVAGGQNAPITTRDAQTKVLVRDGGTTVIGGIYQINDQTAKNAIPGLSKIPLVGWLFRNREITTRHDELLIFITPRIMKY